MDRKAFVTVGTTKFDELIRYMLLHRIINHTNKDILFLIFAGIASNVVFEKGWGGCSLPGLIRMLDQSILGNTIDIHCHRAVDSFEFGRALVESGYHDLVVQYGNTSLEFKELLAEDREKALQHVDSRLNVE